jgi:hypothetical protein
MLWRWYIMAEPVKRPNALILRNDLSEKWDLFQNYCIASMENLAILQLLLFAMGFFARSCGRTREILLGVALSCKRGKK